jgi:environmental stress-induced protein Ves
MIVLRESSYESVPWKNGGGITRQIHREPPEPAMFDWRLSLATIDRAGPFSTFDDYERTLVLVRGAGVELDFGPHGRSRLACSGDSVSFAGEWPTACALLDGPSTDLNLIVSRARIESTSRCVEVNPSATVPTAGWPQTVLCCISGAVRITTGPGLVADLDSADVARCFPGDGVVHCQLRDTTPARLFIAGVRRRQVAGQCSAER